MTLATLVRALTALGTAKEIADAAQIGETFEALIRWVKGEAFARTIGRNWFVDLFSLFEDPEDITGLAAPRSVPYHPRNIPHVFYEVMRKAIEFSAVYGQDMGSESIGEMLSEGLSSALETNYNAALQTILNVWKGSLPPDLSFAYQLGSRLKLIDKNYAVSQLAPVSALPQSILEALTHSANQQLQQLYSTAEQQVISWIELKNEALLAHIRAVQELITSMLADTLADIPAFIDRLESELAAGVNVLLERATARIDDLNASKARYDAGLMTDEEFNDLLAEINADLQGMQDSLSDLQQLASDLISDYVAEYSAKVSDIASLAIDWLSDLENALIALADKSITAANALNLVSELKSKIKEIYEDIRAYRKSGFTYS